MVAIARILAPSDFSNLAHTALELSLSLGENNGATVRVLHVRQGSCDEPADAIARTLWELVGPSRGRCVNSEAAVMEDDDVPRAILDEARRWPADLVVMGTHGLRGRRVWGLGSVTESVLRAAPCPVLVLSQETHGGPRGRPVPFGHILCPWDFSDTGRQALEYASAFHRGRRPRLTLLHVIEGFPEHGSAEQQALKIPEYRLDLSESARERLRAVTLDPSFAGWQHDEIVAVGRPHREILRVARERAVDLIVLGVHCRRAHDQGLYGTTLCHVVREATCPVLAVRLLSNPMAVAL
jgi:nucleotide-binding universal stress UspA family protein